jgi:hypothetical protein
MADRIQRFGRHGRSRRTQFLKNIVETARTLFPAREPGADISPAGHGGEVIKFFQDSLFSQALDGAKSESRAADAAAGNA